MSLARVRCVRTENGSLAIGFVRLQVSVDRAPCHVREIERHARGSGYRYLSTMHPPTNEPNPLAYIRARATELDAEVIVVFDLAHVDNQPHLFCDLGYRLETVCPQQVWESSVPSAVAEVPVI